MIKFSWCVAGAAAAAASDRPTLALLLLLLLLALLLLALLEALSEGVAAEHYGAPGRRACEVRVPRQQRRVAAPRRPQRHVLGGPAVLTAAQSSSSSGPASASMIS